MTDSEDTEPITPVRKRRLPTPEDIGVGKLVAVLLAVLFLGLSLDFGLIHPHGTGTTGVIPLTPPRYGVSRWA